MAHDTALLAWCSAAALAACGGGGGATLAPADPAPAVLAYVQAVLDTMQHNSVNRARIDWPTLRTNTLANVGAAQRLVDAYPALEQAVQALGDHHSTFFPPGTLTQADPAPGPLTVPSGRLLDARTAYVFVPYFSGRDPNARADSTQALIRTLDAQGGPSGPCGWVVDLRSNPGGDPWAMVGGLGPLLGDGTAGVFALPDSTRFPWYYQAGRTGIVRGGVDSLRVTVQAPYTLRRAAAGAVPAVAVLYGPQTASAAEVTAISFRGLPNARSFGTPTAGLSTGNTPFTLSDGAVLNLTTTVEGDRTGRLYGGVLTPDTYTAPYLPRPASADVDSTMQAAARWLAAQPACAATARSAPPARAPAAAAAAAPPAARGPRGYGTTAAGSGRRAPAA